MEDIENLSNKDLVLKLKSLGLKSGPVTKATRRVFEGLLRKYYEEQNDNNNKDSNDEKLEETDSRTDQAITEKVDVISTKSATEKSEASFADDQIDAKITGFYHGICRSNCANADEKTTDKSPLVYTSLNHALRLMKSMKGARLKTFTTRNEAERFSLSSYNEPISSNSQSVEPVIPYKSPTPQELVIFRKKIENGDIDSVKSTVYENPKYLVSSVELPVILQEGSRYNAMHVAVKANQLEICQLIVDILEDDDFWKLMFTIDNELGLFEKRKSRMLDYYLNSPDKGAGDTPLHLACKFGFADIVKWLVSIPFVEREKANKLGDRPVDLVCSRLDSDQSSLRKKRTILQYFEASVCVPLLRAEDNSLDPILGDPVPINVDPCTTGTQNLSPSSPLNPKFMVRAYAGPMSPKQAEDFIHLWRSPQRKNFMNDFEKGKERIGRKLAVSHKVPWREYWSFLGCFTDLKSETGLDHLEQYFRNELENYQKNDIDIYATPARGKLFFNKPSNWNNSERADNIARTFNTKLSFEHADEIMSEIDDGVQVENSDGCVKNLCDAFNQKSPTDRSVSKSSESSNEGNLQDDLKQTLGHGETVVSLENNWSHNCTEIEKMMAGLSLDRENIGDENDKEKLVEADGIKSSSNPETYSSESSAESSTLGDQSEYKIKSLSVCNSVFESDVNDSLDMSNNSVFVDSPFQISQIQKTDERSTMRKTSSNTQRFESLGTSLFIKGMFPSKLDFDVYRALEGVSIDKTKYPHINRWMHKVNTYSNEDKNRWPSPCSPRFRSKIRHPDALWSL